MKSIAEIADEYAVNVESMKRQRDALYERMQAEPQAEVRFRLYRSINSISKAIGDSQYAIAVMRGGYPWLSRGRKRSTTRQHGSRRGWPT